MAQEIWYHGSPRKLTLLRAGSSVTRERRLAEAFSHKPTILCMEDDGTIRHNGSKPGYLYVVDEEVAAEDVRPHPRSTMEPALEWLIARSLRLRLVAELGRPSPEELLAPEDVSELRARAERRNGSER